MSFPAYPQTDRQKQIVTIAQELAETFARRAAAVRLGRQVSL